jgi:hypothetical protein
VLTVHASGRDHIADEGCWCGPTPIPVERESGEIVWVYAHQVTPGAGPAEQADRAATIAEAIAVARAVG